MIKEILEQYSIKIPHAMQVKTYALMLFDAMKDKFFDFGEREKKYLEYAALLHDAGYFTDAKSHHKHSLNLILNMELEDFSKEEIQIIAHLARYHRSSLPDETKHKRFAELESYQKEIILKLGPLLKIADGLDNPHKNLITGIEVESCKEEFVIYIRTVGFAPKLVMAQNKSDFFEKVYKKPVRFEVKKLR